mmetsp:Transcript_51572/g.120277  ORF Transcript_51572/g.120277 Transcript_51572/m.120277 type:complete len:83 (-) Transcript_51572:1091-1339(-)
MQPQEQQELLVDLRSKWHWLLQNQPHWLCKLQEAPCSKAVLKLGGRLPMLQNLTLPLRSKLRLQPARLPLRLCDPLVYLQTG